MNTERQKETQAISEPMIEEAISRMANAGLTAPEIAQALILMGSGMLARSLGPKGAGHAMRNVADKAGAWMHSIADQIERRVN